MWSLQHRAKKVVSILDWDLIRAFGRSRVDTDPTLRGSGQISKTKRALPILTQRSGAQARKLYEIQPRYAYDAHSQNAMIDPSYAAISLERANMLFGIFVIALIIGALITIVSTTALIWISSVRNQYSDQQLRSAIAQSEQAKADAARSNERAAELFMRAQQLSLEQQKIRLESDKAHALAAWRRIDGEQHSKIVKALQGHLIEINLLTSGNDPETSQFADDIVRTLKAAGVNVNSSVSLLPIPIHGIGLSTPTSSAGFILLAALRGAGLDVKDLPAKDPPMLVIGSKPAPF